MGVLFDVTLFVPGLPFDGRTLTRRSLGGSETAGLQLARALAARGHHVTVFANLDTAAGDAPGVYDGVTYLPADKWATYATTVPHDIAIAQRLPDAFRQRLSARLNVLWCHDLAMLRQATTVRGTLWNIDDVAVLSAYMADQYRAVYGADLPLFETRNGLDLALVADALRTAGPRRPHRLVYAARPERGLDVLLREVVPRVRRLVPDAELVLCGYDNPVDHLAPFYGECRRLAEALGSAVTWAGTLTKPDLYRLYAESGAYVYPTPSPVMPAFAEISCLSAMEAQACGLPIVTSTVGALVETIAPGAGTLIDPGEALADAGGGALGYAWTPAALDQTAAAVARYLTDADAAEGARQAGRARAATLDWAGVAEAWEARWHERLAALNASPARLARHCWRQSDIMAAKALVAATDPGTLAPDAQAVLADLDATLRRDWAFVYEAEAGDPDAYARQYRQIGDTHTDVFDATAQEPRFAHLEAWLRAHPDLARILDYGCAHGSYAVGLANRVGRTWVGVDHDDRSIAWCERNRTTRATYPDTLRFLEGGHDVDLSAEAPFDLLVAQEVLEHVPDPTAVIEALERWIRPGGKVLLTVPFGPWEYMSYHTYPYRAHIWAFDRHDLRDLFGAKADLSIHVMPFGICQELAEPVGWHVIEYTVDPGRPTGRIDMARKLALQRPKETVSVAMIAGPRAEQTLAWCLDSLVHVADEIVIADTGLSPIARGLAASYGARLVPGRPPLTHGFEVPRNEALAACRMDWVLWIDTDERLIEPAALHKYVRQNVYHGYSIKQHHFAVDTTFPPDLPVRLFRRAPYQGIGEYTEALDVATKGEVKPLAGRAMTFYGAIHEHPELALNAGPGPVIVLSDAHLFHVGYETESTRRARFARNWPLLLLSRDRYPERLLNHHFFCRDLSLLNRYELQQTGGRVTAEVRARCEEVKRLYRQHFLGKGTYLGADSLAYYTEALETLGEGVAVTWSVTADKQKASPNGHTSARFASAAEARAEIGRRVDEAVGVLASPQW